MVIVSKLNDEGIAREAILSGIQDYLPLEQVDHRQLSRSLLFAICRHQLKQTSFQGKVCTKTCAPRWYAATRATSRWEYLGEKTYQTVAESGIGARRISRRELAASCS